MNKSFSITLIGSGNMAYCLGEALVNAGYTIQEVNSRNKKTGKSLAKKLNSKFNESIQTINSQSSIYIICVSDQSIEDVVNNFPFNNKLILHTSGVTSTSIFENKFDNYGVIYPIQSLTSGIKYDWKNIPICIEANNLTSESKIKSISKSISKQVFIFDSNQRKQIHLAAVFANNFTNALYGISETLLKSEEIPFKILNSIIVTTAEKAIQKGPISSQTGPARRNDLSTIKKHLALLKDNKEEKKIYLALTSYIQNIYKS